MASLRSRQIDILANLGSYERRFVLRRLLGTSMFAIILLLSVKLIIGTPFIDFRYKVLGYIIVIMAFNSVSEISFLLIRYFRKSTFFQNRILSQVLSIVTITALIVYLWVLLVSQFFQYSDYISHRVTQFSILFGVFFVVIMHVLIIASGITQQWIESQNEVEHLKNAKLLSDYNSLQDRLNPHFLFNNLSVLKSLIRYNPKSAEKFTQNFTDVYRYVLKSHESQLVSVASELEFLEAYVAMHQERLGEGLQVLVGNDDAALEMEIPPMSIQLLVENAIKHNVVTRLKPLYIHITCEDCNLCVRNKINRKQTTYSTHTGLKTLKSQYELISDSKVVIVDDGETFFVSMPLL